MKGNYHVQNGAARGLKLRLSLMAILASVACAAGAATKTYTLNADFALGILDGVNYTAVANKLPL